MDQLNSLSKLFAEVNTYPVSSYSENSPLRVFQQMFPQDPYSKDMEKFLAIHDYAPTQRGADLPWWGKSYFTNDKGNRVMIISQDSLALDSGSIVFFSHLMGLMNQKIEYENYCNRLNKQQTFKYNSWQRIRNQILDWNLDFNMLYITDASKVYKKGSWRDRDFDRSISKALLETEIDLCEPDLIILLGASPLYLLDKSLLYSEVVEANSYIKIRGRNCVVAPFPSGNGLTQPNFGGRMETASLLIRSAFKK